jgi:hypothetical protein
MGLTNAFGKDSEHGKDSDVIYQGNPCEEMVEPAFLKVYYLAPQYVTNDIHSLHTQDLELFELAIIHNENVRKMSPTNFQEYFNNGTISDEGYIVIK